MVNKVRCLICRRDLSAGAFPPGSSVCRTCNTIPFGESYRFWMAHGWDTRRRCSVRIKSEVVKKPPVQRTITPKQRRRLEREAWHEAHPEPPTLD